MPHEIIWKHLQIKALHIILIMLNIKSKTENKYGLTLINLDAHSCGEDSELSICCSDLVCTVYILLLSVMSILYNYWIIHIAVNIYRVLMFLLLKM